MRNILGPHSPTTQTLLKYALKEDAPHGDITSNLLFSSTQQAEAAIVSRTTGIYCGNEIIRQILPTIDPNISIKEMIHDGNSIAKGQKLASLQGSARNILLAERITLNLIQRLCGIATLTNEFVSKTSHTKARITDTRKTTPGLRDLERYAVRCGGGYNHRNSLSDTILVKDNHLFIATGGDMNKINTVLRELKNRVSHTTHIEVEVDSLEQIDHVLRAKVNTIMLDNFSIRDTEKAIKIISGQALIEASGGINLNNVMEVAETGVDIISVGALTHSAQSLDIGLDMEIV